MSEVQEYQRRVAEARRAARRVGLLVRKSRQRAVVPNLDNIGKLMLVDGERGYVVGGSRFELSPQDVLQICASRASG